MKDIIDWLWTTDKENIVVVAIIVCVLTGLLIEKIKE